MYVYMCDRDQKPQFNPMPFWLLIAAFSLAFTTRQALAAEARRAAEEAAWERQLRGQAELRLAAEAEQVRIEAARNVQEPAGYYPGWWWLGNYNSTPHHHGQAPHHNHMHQGMPAVGITSSPISPFI